MKQDDGLGGCPGWVENHLRVTGALGEARQTHVRPVFQTGDTQGSEAAGSYNNHNNAKWDTRPRGAGRAHV